jgi:hypothetical protein
MDGERALVSAPRPRGGHPAVPAQWGGDHGAQRPAPRCASRDRRQGGKGKVGKGEADRWAPLGSDTTRCECGKQAEGLDGPAS